MALDFDPETHTYTLDGQAVPSVTQVLKPLLGWYGDGAEGARVRGSDVHSLTAQHDWGLSPAVPEDLAPYIAAWEKFKENLRLCPVAVEKRVAHPVWLYAGTLDRVMRFPGGTVALVDIKTSVSLEAWIGCQLAAYREAWNHERPKAEQITKSLAVSLRADGTYALRTFADHPGDWAMFTSLLTEARWKERNNWAA